MATPQILRSTGSTPEVTFYVAGTGTAADGTVTYAVTTADGEALVSGSATHAGSGLYRFTLAPRSTLNLLKIVWEGTFSGVVQSATTYVEVVGNHLFTEAGLRAFDNGVLASTSDYTSAEIADARAEVTDLLEAYTGVSWVPRYRRERIIGDGTTTLLLPSYAVTTILTVSRDGTALTEDELDDLELEGSVLYNPAYWATTAFSGLVVEYEHGYEYLNDNVQRIAMKWAAKLLVSSDLPSNMQTYSNESGTYLYAPAAPSGDREIDGWIRGHRTGIH